MIYSVNYSDPRKSPIMVNLAELNSTTSLNLVGKNYTRYGEIIAENSLHLLENFAYKDPPANPTEGQLWYNNEDTKLRLYDGTQWKTLIDNIDFGFIENVYYVAVNGDDNNSGRTLADPFKTIDRAMDVIAALDVDGYNRSAATVFVKSGTYTINNPKKVPRNVAIVGDGLRAVNIRPKNPTLDIFWVNNAVYITGVTFRGHRAPSAAVAFPPDGSAGIITTSPYVQNSSSITSTGTGMRVDGAHALGLRSMVLDAYTQYNQGGIGVHMLNGGNSQLVSLFTICCDKAILCESGGFCSATNSNSSFGNYGLVADGVSDTLYTATVKERDLRFPNLFKIRNLTVRPNTGDAVKFATNAEYFTLDSISDLYVEDSEGDPIVIESADFSVQSSDLQTARNTLLEIRELSKIETIKFLSNTYPGFFYDQAKCSRDVGLIVNAVTDDMAFGTNYRTVIAALKYYRSDAELVIDLQLPETIAALEFLKEYILSYLTEDTLPYSRISDLFDIMITVLETGLVALPVIVFTNPAGVLAPVSRAKTILQNNRAFLIEEGIAYISAQYPSLSYDQTKCRRDIGYIVDAVTYDILYQGNARTADAADEYFYGGELQLPEAERSATSDTFDYIRQVAAQCLLNTPVARLNSTVAQNTSSIASNQEQVDRLNSLFEIVTQLLTNGYCSDISVLEAVRTPILENTAITFHQFSLITASGHTLEWIGSGTDVNSALPYLGGVPIEENEIIQTNGGRVYFTATNQKGDFKIGTGLMINRAKGTIEGRVFRRSLYGIMTPYILAIGGD